MKSVYTKEKRPHAVDAYYRKKAKELFHDEGTLEVEDFADVSIGQATDDEPIAGAYVAAWVWVPAPEENSF